MSLRRTAWMLGPAITLAALAVALFAAGAGAATITPSITTDELNAANADCSLREAVSIANSDSNAAEPDCPITGTLVSGGDDTITLGSNPYTLSIAGSSEDQNATGDLDPGFASLDGDLVIDGQGVGSTSITQNASPDDRVLHAFDASLTVQDLSVTGGTTTGIDPVGRGGGIHVQGDLGASLNLTNARVNGNTAATNGGGIGTFGAAAVTLTNTEVSNNTANFTNGGGIYSQGSLSVSQGSVIQGNTANSGDGGGVEILGTGFALTNSTVTGNHATGPFGDGGGIDLLVTIATTATITGSRITGNDAGAEGGGIHSFLQGPSPNNRLVITDSLIEDNVATSTFSPPHGGGLYIDQGVVEMDSTIVRSNDAAGTGPDFGGQGGGIQVQLSATLRATDSLVHANTASTTDTNAFVRGGGIGIFDGTVELRRTTVSANTLSGPSSAGGAQQGAGIFSGAGFVELLLLNSTVSGNTAPNATESIGQGGGIYAWNTALDLISSTVAGNTAGDVGGGADPGDAIFETGSVAITSRGSIIAAADGAEACDGDIGSGGYNVTNDPACFASPGTGDAQGTDPLLQLLGNYGGPAIGPAGFTTPLLTQAPISTSPVLERVPAAQCTDETAAALTTDQRGLLRPVDFDGNSIADCDSGSVELAAPQPPGQQPQPPGQQPQPSPSPAASCAGRSATIVGTNAAEVISGTARADVIAALGGNDRVRGLGGNDTICGGAGKDRLDGGGGRDRLLGESGKDSLNGGGKTDTCIGGAAKDTAAGCELSRKL